MNTPDELVALRRENAVLREALETRKVIELAKALLMWRDGLSEPAAHCYIQKSSMDSRYLFASTIMGWNVKTSRDEASTVTRIQWMLGLPNV